MSTLSLEEEEVSYIQKQKVLNGGKMFLKSFYLSLKELLLILSPDM